MGMFEEAWGKTPKEIINELDGLKSDIGSPYYMYLTFVLGQKQLEGNLEATKRLVRATWELAFATGILAVITVLSIIKC